MLKANENSNLAVLTSHNQISRLENWAGRLLVFLAFGSFILSFVGMYAVAVDAGYGYLAFAWPLVTETAVIIFSLVFLIAKLNGYDNRTLMPLIVACTALSVGFNIWHAPNPEVLTRSVWALPPMFLFAAFKTWIWKVEEDTKRAGMVTTLQELDNQLRSKRQELDKLNAQTQQTRVNLDRLKETQNLLTTGENGSIEKARLAKLAQDNADRDQRLKSLVDILTANPKESVTALAEQLQVSRTTIYNDLSALESNGVVEKNGNGWMVTE